MRIWFVALGCIAFATPVAAQRVVRPGDPDLRADRVRVGTDTIVLLVTPRDSAERLVSTLVRRIERATLDGEPVLRETQRYESKERGGSLDTLDVSARTLAPLRYFTTDKAGSHDIRMNGMHVTGWSARADSARRQVALDMPEPFFVSIMTEAFIAAYPLRQGDTLRVPAANPPDPSMHVLPMVVTGVEAIRTAQGPVECFVIRSPGPLIIWVARSDGRLMRLTWTLPNGTTIWKIPLRDVNFRG